MKVMRECEKCGKEFDLYKFGAPGNPHRSWCWECEPPYYAKSTKRNLVSYDELNALEDRCVRDWED